jgi:FkbM family methyltransferase
MKKYIKLILGYRIIRLIRNIKWFLLPNLTTEPRHLFNRRYMFYRQFVNPNDLVFDVGANVGNRVEPLLRIGAKVVAIEPQEKCRKILRKKFRDNIQLVPFGLGDTEGVGDFFVADVHTISSFSSEWIASVKKDRFKDNLWAKPIKIRITTLDKLILRYGIPKFIKIDVEGYEIEVLKGLTTAIDIISFEYTAPEQVHKVLDCINQIEKFNSEIECNFSSGENMEFALAEWKSSVDFKKYLTTNDFITTSFGDIYIRKIF